MMYQHVLFYIRFCWVFGKIYFNVYMSLYELYGFVYFYISNFMFYLAFLKFLFIKSTIFTINIFNQYVDGDVSLTFLIKNTSFTKTSGFQIYWSKIKWSCVLKKTLTVVFTPEAKHKALPKLEVQTHMRIKLVKKVLAFSFIWHL